MGCCGLAERIDTATVNGKRLPPPQDLDNFNGPIKNRVCRDIIFLILFAAFCIGGAVYVIIVSTKGDINRLIHNYDTYGNICGQKNEKYFNLANSGVDMTSKPFFDFTRVQGLRGQCVSSCDQGSSNNSMSLQVGFYCYSKLTSQVVQMGRLKSIALDMQRSWRQILIIGFIGLVFSLVFTFALRFLAPVIVWVTVIVMAVGSVAGTIALWVFWDMFKKESETLKNDSNPLWMEAKQRSDYFLVGAIFSTIFTVILLIVLIAMRNRIKLVIQLFIEAGKVLAKVPLLLFQPFVTLITLALVSSFYVFGFVLVEVAGDAVQEGQYVKFQVENVLLHMRWYHIFGFFWVSQFVLACQEMIVAGATAIWFFTRNKSKLGSPILTAWKNLVFYHLGSVALGSLIIAIVQMIRLLLRYAESKSKGTGILAGFFKCCSCCFWCFERFLKFLSRNAYIEIAIHGYGFCKSAQMAFKVIMNNVLRVSAINFVGDFVLFLIKLVIVLITFFVGIEIMKHNKEVWSIYPGALIGALIGFFFAYCFISVYEIIIDTLFICFCEDSQINDGIERPYFMSKGLMQFVENSNKALKAHEERERNGKMAKTLSGNGQQVHTIQPTAIPVVYNDNSPLNVPHSPGSLEKTGMTPLHPSYKPTPVPLSASQIVNEQSTRTPDRLPTAEDLLDRKKSPKYDSDSD